MHNSNEAITIKNVEKPKRILMEYTVNMHRVRFVYDDWVVHTCWCARSCISSNQKANQYVIVLTCGTTSPMTCTIAHKTHCVKVHPTPLLSFNRRDATLCFQRLVKLNMNVHFLYNSIILSNPNATCLCLVKFTSYA